MMQPVCDAIVDEIAARLAAIGDAAETEVMPSTDPVGFPARHIFDSGFTIEEGEAGCTRYRLALSIEHYHEQDGGASARAVLGAMYVATVTALLTDPPLGGMAETIDEGDMRVIVAPLASKNRLCRVLDLYVTFSTRRENPAEPA